MEKVTLGKTGLRVSPLGFGAAPIGFLETPQGKVGAILGCLMDHGVNFLDTAAMYRGSEEALGQAIGANRDRFVIQSKCDNDDDELPKPRWSPASITASVERSLRRLRTDQIDIMLLHTCDLDTLKQGEALGTLVSLKEAGKVRFIGYSGDNEAVAYAAALPEVDVVEMSVNICDQANIDHALPVCREHHVGVVAKRPMANAAWRELAQQKGIYQNYAEAYTQRLAAMGIKPMDLGYHGHPEVEWPEIALKFTLAQPGVHVAIVGTTSLSNTQANIDATNKHGLREQVIERLHQAFKAAADQADEPWVGLT